MNDLPMQFDFSNLNLKATSMSSEMNPDLTEFQQFIASQIASGQMELSPEECLSRYRAQNPTDWELDESVAAIETALQQKANGEGKTLAEFDNDFRTRHHF